MSANKAIKKESGEILIAVIVDGQLPDIVEAGDVVIDIELDSLPDRDFRDCWKIDNDIVKIDLPLARAKRMAQLRAERDAELLELDGEQARLISVHGDLSHENVQAIFAQKIALRDMTDKAEADLSAKLSSNTIKAYSLANALEVVE